MSELMAVIGPSGSGKSTLLKLLAGFLTPHKGRILIDGEDVTRLPPHRRSLGVVFQSYALFPHMTAWQNVAYPLKVRGMVLSERRKRALAALERVGLGEFAERVPTTLSGGQQQRVALARALVFEPRALLLDEPLSALDASLRGELRDEIVRVQKEAGITTLHVTHDQEEALSIAQRVAVMSGGRLLQVADPVRLYDRPVSRTVAAFVGHANLWPAAVSAPGQIATSFGTLVCRTDGFAPGAQVTALVRPERVLPLPANDADAGRANTFRGRVVHDRFLGAVRRYDFDPGSGIIRGETANRDGIAAVVIPPDVIRLLPSDQDSEREG
jgi:putative spermidine/putrescine transport system ATP-binding protein